MMLSLKKKEIGCDIVYNIIQYYLHKLKMHEENNSSLTKIYLNKMMYVKLIKNGCLMSRRKRKGVMKPALWT